MAKEKLDVWGSFCFHNTGTAVTQEQSILVHPAGSFKQSAKLHETYFLPLLCEESSLT